MIDLHCHLLPGVDDGPATLEESVELARLTAAAGIDVAAATPHVSRRHPTAPAVVHEGVAALQRAIDAEGIALRVVPGAEIALDMLPDLDDEALGALRLGGGPFLLLEAPLSAGAPDAAPFIASAQRRGFRVLLAHPERSPQFQRAPELLAPLVADGVLVSVTAGAFAGRFGEPARRTAALLLRRGLVHDLSSDLHDVRRRPPGIAEPLAASGEDGRHAAEHLSWYADAVPAAILEGRALPPAPLVPPAAERRRGGSLLGRLSRRGR
ncbi:MAG TPA: CpsB/CapC family capsule biosynthesis tyrosine phosphatase [Baekduia sp.]|nr:CpsB/CapC family capsule biosynthesis tyrosine phosphatase [Baekduia sp.]